MLACRKRRIKCGEEKPICNNCIRSKRECEGYAQRLVFKRPVGPFGTLGSNQQSNAPAQSMTATVPFFGGYGNSIPPQGLPAGSRLPILAPRPSDLSPVGPTTFSTVSDPEREDQVENTAPFHYPPVNIHAPLPLSSETVVGTGQEVLPDEPAYHSTTLDTAVRETSLHSSSQSYNSTNNQTVHGKVPHAQVTPQEATYSTKHASALPEQTQSFRPEV